MNAAPQPAGFGNCARCPYLEGGPAHVCFECARKSFERLADDRCELCELRLKQDGSCGNPLCNWAEEDRYFKWVWAISMRTGPLRRAIDRYKVDGKQAWATIFGRVLAGYLDANAPTFQRYELIVPSPTYVGAGGRDFDHTGLVVQRAAEEDDNMWLFRTDVLTKLKPTTPFRGKTWRKRYEIAQTELRSAIFVKDRELVHGKRVLVYDDVYTEGLTLREVARALQQAGAIEVSEIVLARQPYGG